MIPVYDFDESPRDKRYGAHDASPRHLLDMPHTPTIFKPFEHHGQAVTRRFTALSVRFPANTRPQDFVAGYAKAREMATHFAETLEEAAQFLYQRKARPGTIVQTHQALQKTLEKKFHPLNEKLVEMNDQAKFIPCLLNLSQIASCLDDRFAFSVLQPLRKKAYAKLSVVLDSKEHKDALEFYKKEKTACKALRTAGAPHERVKALDEIFKRTAEKCTETIALLEKKPVEVWEQTSKLFQELFAFIAYTSTFPEKKPKESGYLWSTVSTIASYVWTSTPAVSPVTIPELASQLEILRGKIAKEVATLVKATEQAVSQKKSNRVEPEEIDYSLYKKQPMHAASEFRNGSVFEFAFYSEMSDEVQELRNVARALADDLQTLTQYLVTHTVMPEADLGRFERRLEAHKQKIATEHEKLKQLPLSSKIQAGWYYVNRLLEEVRTVEMYCKHLKKLSTKALGLYFIALTSLMEYLKPSDAHVRQDPHYISSSAAVHRLYSAIRNAVFTKTVDPKRSALVITNDIVDTIDQTVATVGIRTLDLSHAEERIVQNILERKPLATMLENSDKALVPESIQTYLMKGYLYKLYFLEPSEVNTEFEIILDILLNDTSYKLAMEQLFEQNSLLQELHADYMQKSDMNNHLDEIREMAKIFAARVEQPQGSTSAVSELFDSCQARQITLELQACAKDNKSEQQRSRYRWLEKMRPKLIAGHPDYFERLGSIEDHDGDLPKLYQHIVTSLYAKNEEVRAQSTGIVERMSNTAEETFQNSPYMKMLLEGWLLVQHVAKGKREVEAGSFLDKLFQKYLNDAETRKSWGCFKGIGFMERALFLSKKNRGEDHKAWKAVLYRYNEYFKPEALQERKKQLILDARKELGNSTLQNPSAETGFRAAVFCISEMMLDYIRTLACEFYTTLPANTTLITPPLDLNKINAYKQQVQDQDRKLYQNLQSKLETGLDILGVEFTLSDDNTLLAEAQQLYWNMRTSLQLRSLPFLG